MDCSPPGSSVHGILQSRIPEWWPFPSPQDLPDPGIEPAFPAYRQILCQLSHQGSPGVHRYLVSNRDSRPLIARRWSETLLFALNFSIFWCACTPGSSVHGILQPRKLSGLLFPPPGVLPDPGIEPTSPTFAGGFSTLTHQGSMYITIIYAGIQCFNREKQGYHC